MGESLTQPRRVQEDTPTGRKLLFCEKNDSARPGDDGIAGIRTG
jgi:hypothetical protein